MTDKKKCNHGFDDDDNTLTLIKYDEPCETCGDSDILHECKVCGEEIWELHV